MAPMVTRLFMALVLAFWLVMTVLLVRYTYFPESSQFAEVPPRVVMKLFLEQGNKTNAMYVYHYEKKIGHASVMALPVKGIDSKPGDPPVHLLKISGLLERGMLKSVDQAVVWRLDARLNRMEEFEYLKGTITLQDPDIKAEFVWNSGEKAPTITFSQRGGEPAPELQMMQTLLRQMLGSGKQTVPDMAAVPDEKSVHLITREGSMNIGGQKRQGYTLELGATESWRLKAFFTEAGELALVNLPDGYRLMEQTIYGLTPDYGKEEEE